MLRLFCVLIVAVVVSGCAGTTQFGTADVQPNVAFDDKESDGAVVPSPASSVATTSATGVEIAAVQVSDAIVYAGGPTEVVAARKAADQAALAATHRDNAYRIGTFDVLKISIFNVPELSKTLQVSEAGTINFPLLGDLKVAGSTTRELEVNLAMALAEDYLQSPQVAVQVTEFNSQQITVDGAVNQPGVYPLSGPLTLLQAIASAKGLTTSADTRVVVFREFDGKRRAAKFDLSAIRSGDAQDPALKAGDVIIASDSLSKKALDSIFKIIPIAHLFVLL